jgi:transposase InsO family protein
VLWELSVVEQRFTAVQEVLGGMPVTAVADRYGVSRQSVHAWLRRYQAGGLAGLEDRSHRPRSCPHQASAQVETAACELRRQHPGGGRCDSSTSWSAAALVKCRRGLGPTASWSVTGWWCPAAPGRRRSDFRRWQREAPMQLRQLDIVGGIRLADGSEVKLVSGIDDHARYCVIAALVARATGRAVCAAFAAALARYGVPAEVLTDKGRQFTGRFGKPRPAEVLFDRICRENAIVHRLTGVRSPTTTGKVERFHKTLRTELLATLPPFPAWRWPRRSSTTGSATTTLAGPIRGSGWPHRLPGSRPRRRIRTCPATRCPARVLAATPLLGPLELEVVVPACGNLGLAGRQLWLGRRHAGNKVSLWIDHQVIHLSTDGRPPKTVASRFTTGELPRLVQLGARPAGHPPTTPARHHTSDVVEVDRLVNAAGLIGLGGRQLPVGQHHAGQQVTVCLDTQLATSCSTEC